MGAIHIHRQWKPSIGNVALTIRHVYLKSFICSARKEMSMIVAVNIDFNIQIFGTKIQIRYFFWMITNLTCLLRSLVLKLKKSLSCSAWKRELTLNIIVIAELCHKDHSDQITLTDSYYFFIRYLPKKSQFSTTFLLCHQGDYRVLTLKTLSYDFHNDMKKGCCHIFVTAHFSF